MLLLPRYRPIRNLPTSNSSAVAAAPTQTSRQSMCVDGMNLKIIANSAVAIASDTTKFSACSSASMPA